MKVLVLGGTSEGRALAGALDGDARFDLVTSLAGRVREPLLPEGATRVGGFGGADGLAEWIRGNDVDALVDATHPFATEMSANAHAAAARTDIPLVQLVRREWIPGHGDRWTDVRTLTDAASVVESTARRAFLTIGRQGVNAFSHIERTWFLLRSIDPPQAPMPPAHELLLARGPFALDDEIALMKKHRIDVLVTKNSGGAMTEAKLTAARELEIPVVMIARPSTLAGDFRADSAEEVVDWLCSIATIRAVGPGISEM